MPGRAEWHAALHAFAIGGCWERALHALPAMERARLTLTLTLTLSLTRTLTVTITLTLP